MINESCSVSVGNGFYTLSINFKSRRGRREFMKDMWKVTGLLKKYAVMEEDTHPVFAEMTTQVSEKLPFCPP